MLVLSSNILFDVVEQVWQDATGLFSVYDSAKELCEELLSVASGDTWEISETDGTKRHTFYFKTWSGFSVTYFVEI